MIWIVIAVAIFCSLYVARYALLSDGPFEHRLKRLEDGFEDLITPQAEYVFELLVNPGKRRNKTEPPPPEHSNEGKDLWVNIATGIGVVVFSIGGLLWTLLGFIALFIGYILRSLFSVAVPAPLDADASRSSTINNDDR